MSLFAADAELVSPISGRMTFQGQHDLRVLFDAVYGSLTGLVWQEQVTDGKVALLRGETRVGPFRLADVMVIELAPDGRNNESVRISDHCSGLSPSPLSSRRKWLGTRPSWCVRCGGRRG